MDSLIWGPMTQLYNDSDSELVPGGVAGTTVVSDAHKNHALASLVLGLNKDSILEAVKVQEGGLETVISSGSEKFTYFLPVTDADITQKPGKYNGNSVGLVKAIITFEKLAVVGDAARQTLFYYQFASFPKFVSHIRDEQIQLTQQVYDQFHTP